MTGRGRYYNANRGPRVGTTRANKYVGTCDICGQDVAPGRGFVRWNGAGWVTRHLPKEWVGSPVSGTWVGGCHEDRTGVTE